MNQTETKLSNAENSTRVPVVPWGWRDMIAAIVVAAAILLALNLVVFAASLALGLPLRENSGVLTLFLVIQDLVVVGVAWWFGPVRYRVGGQVLGLRAYFMPLGCSLSLALLLLSYVIRFLYSLIAIALGLRIEQQQILTRLDLHGVGFLLTLVAAAIVAPIAEEIFFRGFLYAGLRGRIGVAGAMLASTALFTALHMSVELFIPIFVLGLFLAVLYEATGSLYPSMLLHAANNALSLILFFILQSSELLPNLSANILNLFHG
ncbi:MAG: CPBP family intramembrane metalloprotease [Chloroflexi bacterium]|nr:CPBP family intramembrane metalloprotease [Chloroflexota bacterium]